MKNKPFNAKSFGVVIQMPEDFYSIDLMNAYAAYGNIIGEEIDDEKREGEGEQPFGDEPTHFAASPVSTGGSVDSGRNTLADGSLVTCLYASSVFCAMSTFAAASMSFAPT